MALVLPGSGSGELGMLIEQVVAGVVEGVEGLMVAEVGIGRGTRRGSKVQLETTKWRCCSVWSRIGKSGFEGEWQAFLSDLACRRHAVDLLQEPWSSLPTTSPPTSELPKPPTSAGCACVPF